MKIFIVNAMYPPDVGGGAEIIVEQQAALLVERGHEVHVYALSGTKEYSETISGKLTVHRCPQQNVYFQLDASKQSPLRKIRWHLRDSYNRRTPKYLELGIDQHRPDVVLIHNLAGWSISIWRAIKERRIPIVQILHDQYFLCLRSNMFRRGSICNSQCMDCSFVRRSHAKASSLVDAVVGVSKFVLHKLLERGMFSSVSIREVVYNARRPLNQPGSPPFQNRAFAGPTFGYIGSVNESKGVEVALSAFMRVLEKLPIARFLVAGDGDPKYVDSLKANFSHSSIQFLGHVDPGNFFPNIDFLLATSRWEDTLPSVVFEALSFGIPVISSNRGGIPEMIEHGINGLLVEPVTQDVVSAMLLASTELVPSEDLRQRCIRSARRFYDVERMLNQYEAVIALAIAQAKTTTSRDNSSERLD